MVRYFYGLFLCVLCVNIHSLDAEYDPIDTLEQEIINNILEYQSSLEGGEQAQTRSCLFQTQITQFNIPLVISTPGFYCVSAQTTQNALQNGQNVGQNTFNSQFNTATNNQINGQNSNLNQNNNTSNSLSLNQAIPINLGGQNSFQTAQPSLQTTPFTFLNGHLVQQQQNLTVQQQLTLAQQQLNGQNITVSDLALRAITVNSNDVVINLNGNEIIGVGTNTNGIIVNGRSNIIIKNGTIRNMTNNGITIGNNTSSGQRARNILIQNVTFISNRNGFSISNATDVILLQNEAYFCTAIGFILNQNSNVLVESCISNNNSTGFSTAGNVSLEFVRCNANNNTVAGFLNNFLVESLFQGCTAHENQNGFITGPTNGISTDVNFMKCYAHGNTTNGFQIGGNEITFEECKANNNTNGFQINGNNNVLLNNIAQGNANNGILLAAALSVNTTSSNCQVRENTLTSNNIGINNLGVNNHIYSNFASNNPGGDFLGVPNVVVSPTPLTPINFTTNIAE